MGQRPLLARFSAKYDLMGTGYHHGKGSYTVNPQLISPLLKKIEL
ncbi:hypothetical protein GFS31_28710 [Leptolyngbya sp. BL0902]|nr:hypothetical protein GFS31_28710 [Leptolyngbya sp. BL0902]